MKLKIMLILLISNFSIDSFCQIESTWIGKYHTAIEENKTDKFLLHQIVKIDGNKLIEYHFNKDFLFSESKIDTSNIKFNESNIIINRKNKIDTLEFRIENGNLTLIDKARDNLLVYEPLSSYKQSKNISKFQKFINTNIFKINGEESNVEFDKNHKLILSNLDFYWGDNQYWILEEFEDELFLIIDGYFGTIFHIKEYNENGFEGMLYAPENMNYKLIRLDSARKYDTKKLISKWEISSKVTPPPPFKSVEDSLRYVNKETLIFSDSTLTFKYGFKTHSTKWETNISNELILLSDLSENVKEQQWNIIELTDDKLIIERKKRRRVIGEESKFETIEYYKIKQSK